MDQFDTSNSWVLLSPIEKTIKEKIEKAGTPLREWNIQISRGIITGLNEAFIISTKKRNEILSNCETDDERIRTEEIIRPILRGRDIRKYSYQFSDLYVILAYFGFYQIAKDLYPAIYNHLCQYEEKLRLRGQCRYSRNGATNVVREYTGQHHWLELDNNPSLEKLDDFNKPKIFYREISEEMNATYAQESICINNKAYIITGNHLIYILCYLNSSIFNKVILECANSTGGKGAEFLLSQKLFKPSLSQEKYVINLFNELLGIHESTKRSVIESQINDYFYSIYGLTSEEKNFIETKNSQQ